MDIRPDHLAAVKRILAQYVPTFEVRAYGSRVQGTAKRYSDLDLAVRSSEEIDMERLWRLREAFEESDIPFRVDVVDWTSLSDAFREIIEQSFEIIQHGESHPNPLPSILSGQALEGEGI